MADTIIWGIHIPREHSITPIEGGYIEIGWNEMGDLSKIRRDRESFKSAYSKHYPNAKSGTIPVAAGVTYRFVVDMKVGDYIIFPSKPDRMINIGIINGEYEYIVTSSSGFHNRRKVKWIAHIPRASFSQSALNEIGSAVTLFQINNNSEEFLSALSGEILYPDAMDKLSAEQSIIQAEETTEDFIIKRLKTEQTPYQFEFFIAHLLKCMGYHARVTQAAGDGGIDIIAHRDELGFDPPIIKVQCKQILSTIGRPEVQKLFGAIEREEKGLFVTLGAYSSDARTFEQTKPNLRLIDGTDLIQLIYEHYHQFEPRYQMLLPLKRAYIAAPIGRDRIDDE